MGVYDLANPERFDRLARGLIPWTGGAAGVLILAGLYLGLVGSPADEEMGDGVRMMYVHVPAAWMAMACYTSMAAASVAGFVWKHPLADVSAKATAPIGAVFTALALITGAIWGKPMWGAWWAWDARLTSVLILFFLYLGYIAVWNAVEDRARAARLAAIVAIVGFVNIPIIKFSVDWWYSLHQPASVIRSGGSAIHSSMLWPLLAMALGYTILFVALLLAAMRNEIMARRIRRLEQAQQGAASTVRMS